MPIRALQRRMTGNNDVGMVWIAATARRTCQDGGRRHRADARAAAPAPAAPDDFLVHDIAQINQVMQQTTRF